MVETPIDRPVNEPATVRIAMWSSRHRWPVAAGWFVATIGLFVLSLSLGGIRADNPNGNPNEAQTESSKAYAVFNASGTGTPSEDVTIVVTHASLTAASPAFQAFVHQAVGQLSALTVAQGGASVPATSNFQSAMSSAAARSSLN